MEDRPYLCLLRPRCPRHNIQIFSTRLAFLGLERLAGLQAREEDSAEENKRSVRCLSPKKLQCAQGHQEPDWKPPSSCPDNSQVTHLGPWQPPEQP